MDELIQTLLHYKSLNPTEKTIFGGYDTKDYNGFSKIEQAIALTYGVNLNDSNAQAHENYNEALEAINNARQNNLIHMQTELIPTGEINNYAVLYTETCYKEITGEIEYDIMRNIKGSEKWKVFETQLSNDNEKIYVSQRPCINDKLYNYAPANTGFYVRENNNTKVIERLIDYLDWCCSDEGIIISYFGEEGNNYAVDENGIISELGSGNIGGAIKTVSHYYAYRHVLSKYVSQDYLNLYEFSHYDAGFYSKIYKAFSQKELTNIQITDFDHGQFHTLQILRTNTVFFCLFRGIMSTTIHFNDQANLFTIEIYNVVTNRFLPLKSYGMAS
jgi:hypothetical protein